MKKIAWSIITLLALNSCGKKTPKLQTQPIAPTEQTPEVLEEKELFSGSMEFKRGYSNILEDLFQEAVEKNLLLEDLKANIKNFEKQKQDSLQPYYTYLHNNKNYWSSANSLIDKINDSTLNASLKKQFKKLEVNYQSSIKSLTDEKELINKKEKVFQDKYSVLKLMVTLNMIENYQKNEKPSLKTLENIKSDQEKIIEQTEKNTPK